MKDNFGYVVLRFLFSPLVKFIYRPKLVNTNYIPKNGPVILCGNHRNALDPLLVVLSTNRTIHFLAKQELFMGVKKAFFNLSGSIPVNRESKDKNAVNMALEYLKNGHAIGIFPEGTRNKTKKLLLPFKFGAVSLSKKTGALIVPFAITGKFKLFSKDLAITFDKPFKVDGDLEEANEKLMRKIENLLIERKK